MRRQGSRPELVDLRPIGDVFKFLRGRLLWFSGIANQFLFSTFFPLVFQLQNAMQLRIHLFRDAFLVSVGCETTVVLFLLCAGLSTNLTALFCYLYIMIDRLALLSGWLLCAAVMRSASSSFTDAYRVICLERCHR